MGPHEPEIAQLPRFLPSLSGRLGTRPLPSIVTAAGVGVLEASELDKEVLKYLQHAILFTSQRVPASCVLHDFLLYVSTLH